MTKQQINNAIEFIDNEFNSMTMDKANTIVAGNGFYYIFEKAIDQAFDTPEEAANWWMNSDPMIDKAYNKIHDHYVMAHAKMWKRLHHEEYNECKTMTRKTKAILLKAAKTHFKLHPSGSIEINYAEPIPASGEIGTFCYDYKTFKFEIGYAISQSAQISSIVFKC